MVTLATVLLPQNIVRFSYYMSNNTFKNEDKGVFVVNNHAAFFVAQHEEGIMVYNFGVDAVVELQRCAGTDRDPACYNLFSASSDFIEDKTFNEVISDLLATLNFDYLINQQ